MSSIGIVGGGPAGVALAKELDRFGKKYVIYEAREIGATWAAVPEDLKVLSPWWTNILEFSALFDNNPFGKSSARNFLCHLKYVSNKLKGIIKEFCKIDGITYDSKSNIWTLRSDKGEKFLHDKIVIASGYFFSPSGPDPMFNTDGSVFVIHSAGINDYNFLINVSRGERLLIVGARVTAGQLMLELDKRNIPFDLSIRSPIEFRRHGLFASLRECLYFFYEELSVRLNGAVKKNSYPGMDGGRTQWLLSHGVNVYGKIIECEDGHVLFEGGQKKFYSAIILATGYFPCTGILASAGINIDGYGLPVMDGFKVKDFEGIYLLGFDNLYDHRSRYLRGIRSDAKRLAKLL